MSNWATEEVKRGLRLMLKPGEAVWEETPPEQVRDGMTYVTLVRTVRTVPGPQREGE